MEEVTCWKNSLPGILSAKEPLELMHWGSSWWCLTSAQLDDIVTSHFKDIFLTDAWINLIFVTTFIFPDPPWGSWAPSSVHTDTAARQPRRQQVGLVQSRHPQFPSWQRGNHIGSGHTHHCGGQIPVMVLLCQVPLASCSSPSAEWSHFHTWCHSGTSLAEPIENVHQIYECTKWLNSLSRRC